ncbi:hypothetical protein OsJ_09863 [Oryza sativa Japonica Group]|uniref:Uncharacterized protein n=2 Tax=Oryza sativa subsp. japonica TaxID=39947 RepID=Q10Q56_ORYSJ|nr:hypothetical protein LOC_Os03g11080 [Oryza sativa Japonica Group]EAZ26010.1 hypothetical protein OsJ_09863 [Oryza sativa Japonica Group]
MGASASVPLPVAAALVRPFAPPAAAGVTEVEKELRGAATRLPVCCCPAGPPLSTLLLSVRATASLKSVRVENEGDGRTYLLS